ISFLIPLFVGATVQAWPWIKQPLKPVTFRELDMVVENPYFDIPTHTRSVESAHADFSRATSKVCVLSFASAIARCLPQGLSFVRSVKRNEGMIDYSADCILTHWKNANAVFKNNEKLQE